MRVPLRRSLLGLVMTAAALSVVNCYPLGFDSTSELDTVVTWRNEALDTSGLRTYDLPERVIDLCDVEAVSGAGGAVGAVPGGLGGLSGAADCHEVSHAFDADIVGAIHRNMQSLGYQRVTTTDAVKPDVIVVPGIVASYVWIVYQYYPWCWYYPLYTSYCGGWYPPSQAVGVKYPAGTIVMSMIPAGASDVAAESSAIWVAGTHGLSTTGESQSSIRSRINKNIDQAFIQSPYLKVPKP